MPDFQQFAERCNLISSHARTLDDYGDKQMFGDSLQYEWRRRKRELRFLLRSRRNIPTSGKRDVPIKQELRRQFHAQLENLWKWTPFLKGLMEQGVPAFDVESRRIKLPHGGIQYYWGKLQGIEFRPLVTYGSPWECEHLDVRFLLRQERLDTLDPAIGDLDARVQVLCDALRIPHHKDQLIAERENIPNPCFCLFEDDSLIQRMSVETLHLLNEPNVNSDMTVTPDMDHVVHVLVTLKPKDPAFKLFP